MGSNTYSPRTSPPKTVNIYRMAQNVHQMNYSEFVGFIKERNRPSGGIKTVHSVAVNAFLNASKKVLEIGSNTGFTSVNLSLLTGCEVIGVDVNESSIAEAKVYAEVQGAHERVDFLRADAADLPFEADSFDLVWCSNVTSFISDKEKAVSEYLRVLKPGGILAAVPIYYRETPPKDVVEKVSETIGTPLTIRDKKSWKALFETVADKNAKILELFYEEDHAYLDVANEIEAYVDILLGGRFSDLTEAQENKIRERAIYFYTLFNENLKYAGYSIFLYQKRLIQDEAELFLTVEI